MTIETESIDTDYKFTKQRKKPRLFYYEEGVDAWTPAPKNLSSILDVNSHFSSDGDICEIKFKRIDLTDKEFSELPMD